MHARFIMIAAAALAAGTAAPAEPTKAPAKDAAQQTNHPAPVLLASADQVAAPASTDQASSSQAKPHRAARVTTCRCGGQTEEQR
ncbi:MAG TPA: hypothetical protein VE221_07125 [Sphingomicrobium sp.]|nr:hypothetical protein [Sphingomicrobium sp.]